MQKVLLILKYIFFVQLLFSQNYYIKIIDFDSMIQSGLQILPYRDEILIGYYEISNNLPDVKGGILKINQNGEVTDKLLLNNFSNNLNSILIHDQKILLTGEDYINQKNRSSFSLNVLDNNSLDSINTFYIADTSQKYSQIFQLSNVLWDNKIVICGSGIIENDNTGNRSIIYILNEDYSVDTLLKPLEQITGNVSPWETYLDNENNLVVHLRVYDWELDSKYTQIIKYDKSYNIIWKWDSSKILELSNSIPFGFQHNNGNIIVKLENRETIGVDDVYSIKQDSSIAWKMNWLTVFGGDYIGQDRIIDRLRPARNGDILGVGRYSDTRHNDPSLFNVPFIFRISEYGLLKWVKVYYKNQIDPISEKIVEGAFSDIFETDEGDIMAVGKIQNIFQIDPNTEEIINDWDIIIARVAANGCIEEGCGKINVIDLQTINKEVEKYDFQFDISPIPANSYINITTNLDGNVTIMNSKGKILERFEIHDRKNTMDISNFENGIYFIQFISRDKLYKTFKFIKLK